MLLSIDAFRSSCGKILCLFHLKAHFVKLRLQAIEPHPEVHATVNFLLAVSRVLPWETRHGASRIDIGRVAKSHFLC
jgi:hypothetical protein